MSDNIFIPLRYQASKESGELKRRVTSKVYSKKFKEQTMRAIQALSKQERQELLTQSYNKDQVLEDNLILTDAILSRLVLIQTDLYKEYSNNAIELKRLKKQTEDDPDEYVDKKIDSITRNQSIISNNLLAISKEIKSFQNTFFTIFKTKKELREVYESHQLLTGLANQLNTDPRELIQDLIKAYLQSNPDSNLDQVLGLKPAALEVEEAIEFENQDDD